MTEILCRWLNYDVKLSRKISPDNFAYEFASGYLVGEVLYDNGLQLDFDSFSQSRTNESKLNNYTRIEPELRLLDIPFDVNVANDMINEKPGVATRIMYQLHIALQNKKKANLTGVAIDTMKPRANANLNQLTSVMYKEKLKTSVPRQTDLDINETVTKFKNRGDNMMKISFKERVLEEEQKKSDKEKFRLLDMEKLRKAKSRTSDICAKIQSCNVQIPKPPEQYTTKAIAARKELRKKMSIIKMQKEISEYEEKLRQSKLPKDDDTSDDIPMAYIMQQLHSDEEDRLGQLKLGSNDEYMNKIKKRLEEDASAREEREKRRRKVLVDQFQAHESQQEALREEQMVARMMRQAQQEQRIAVQLMQARHEKQVIRDNRIYRLKQIEERRYQDFMDAMNMEREMAALAKIEYAKQIQHDQMIHDQIAAERALACYNKHYDAASGIVHQIFEYACKVAEYRELTSDLIPPKVIREWTSTFISGVPLYDVTCESITDITAQQVLEEERQILLDEGDLEEYKNMMGLWSPNQDAEIKAPYRNNRVLGHIVQRLFDMVYPPPPPPSPPELPEFPIKAAIIGKVFSGKSSCAAQLAQEHRLVVVECNALLKEAIQAHKDNEVQEVILPTPRESSVAVLKETSSKEAGKSKTSIKSNTSPPRETHSQDPANAHPQQPTEAAVPSPAGDATAEKRSNISLGSHQKDESKSKSNDDSFASSIEEKQYEPTPRAVIGAYAMKCLVKGKPVEDQTNVDVVVEALRNLPDGTGWVLDGFPKNYNQARLLEKALTGYDSASSTDKLSQKSSKKRSSMLVSDPHPSKPELDPPSGLNVLVYFDIDDLLCLRRSAGRYYGSESGTGYQMEFNPPPEGSVTGMNTEKVLPVEDDYDQDIMQRRMASFKDHWKKLEKWYSKFGIVRIIDASQDAETMYKEVEAVMEDTIDRIECRGKYAPVIEPEPEPVVEEIECRGKYAPVVEPEPEPVVEEVKAPTPPPPTPPPEEKPSPPPESPKKARSRSRSASKPGKKDSASTKKGERGRSGKKKNATPEPEVPVEPEEPPGPPPPQPDSEEWEFLDAPLEMELAEVLAPHWEGIEASYLKSCKFAFRQCRGERENIIRYFYQIKQDYASYLQRPDHKQQFIDQWQKEFNAIADDTRDDEEMRMELHQRVDDMRERLWSICDEKKERAEEERDAIIANGWLDDRLGLLMNHYISLKQAEVDRFQDTVRMLRDYYAGMDGGPPCENSDEYSRLGLIQISDEADGTASPSATAVVQPTTPVEENKDLKSPKDRSKSPNNRSNKSRTPSGKKRGGSREKHSNEGVNKNTILELDFAPSSVIGKKTKIPILPRVPAVPDATKDKKDKKGKKDDASISESPIANLEVDDRIIIDAHNSAIGIIEAVIAQHQLVRDAEINEERKREAELLKELDGGANKKSAKKKGGKSASPSAKKGKKDASRAASPAAPVVVYTEEEKALKEYKAKRREESAFAMDEEERACKIRLELIKAHTLSTLQDLRMKADDVHKALFDWLGGRFIAEMASIDQISEVVRYHIEKGEQITEQLILKQDNFIINEDCVMTKCMSTSSLHEPTEAAGGEHFTVAQIKSMLNQFLEIGPSGVISTKSFCDTFETMIMVSHGMETLPDMWMNITPSQIQDIGTNLGGDLEYVDWRRFLLSLLIPIPSPTQQELLDTLALFKDMDQLKTGTVTREQFNLMPLWFTSVPPFVIPVERGVIGPYDRLGNLRRLLFDIFGDLTVQPTSLDYVSMLLYFSAAQVPEIGLVRALSVAADTHMPHIFKPSGVPSTLIHVDSSIDLEGDPTLDAAVNEEIPQDALDACVPISALYRVLHHGEKNNGDSHRFSMTGNVEDNKSMERLSHVYHELSTDTTYSVMYRILIEHPLIHDIMSACRTFTLLNVRSILMPSDNFDNSSIKTID